MGFFFFPSKLHFLIATEEIITKGAVLESLEYDVFGSEILRVIPTFNTNGSLLKVEYTTLTKMKTKPVVSKRRIKSNLKAKPLAKVRENISKNKYKPTIEKIPQKSNPELKLKLLTGQDLFVAIQKPHMSFQHKMKNVK